jgi:hypothetical protein
MEMILSIAIGVSLAAACGFRVFVPLFIVSLCSYFNIGVEWLGEDFAWMGQLPALLSFGIASVLELAGYYIPVVDNFLDSAAIPLAAVAGTLVSMSTMIEMQPLLKWSIALVAGGGLAGVIKGVGAKTRLISTATTAGVGNPVVSTAETGAAIFVSVLAWFIPLLAFGLIIVLIYLLFRSFRKIARRKKKRAETT